jgi:hypothetical protein
MYFDDNASVDGRLSFLLPCCRPAHFRHVRAALSIAYLRRRAHKRFQSGFAGPRFRQPASSPNVRSSEFAVLVTVAAARRLPQRWQANRIPN